MNKVSNELLGDIIQKDDASWQTMLYELVKNGQINPWDIDIIQLTDKFLSKIEELDKRGLFISSKILLVAALLVKMKAELLYKSLVEKEVKASSKQEIILDEDIPELFPKIPLARERKISLDELIEALKKAIKTEERRIKKRAYLENINLVSLVLPKRKINWLTKIKEVYEMIKELFRKHKTEKLLFTQLLKEDKKEEKIMLFIPLLHLDFENKLILEQPGFLSEIEIKMRY
ncbi:MAG: segregation/condensation protein A [Candidatus Pacearchaeota archaeon]